MKIRINLKNWADDSLMQTYVQGDGIMYRNFNPVLDEVETISESDLWTNNDLKGGVLAYEDKLYQCTYNKLCTVNANVLEPYRELFACNTQNAGLNTMISDRMFFADRLGETYFSKYLAADWGKHLRVFGARWLYRWIIQPNTDLTTAPVVATVNRRLITNLEFDQTYTLEDINFYDVVHPWAMAGRPILKIEGSDTIEENGFADFTVKAYNSDGSANTDSHLYLVDCKQGYAPNKELQVTNGEGTVRIMALGLHAGDTLRFKINDKVWTDYAEKTVTVVSK